MLMVGSIIGACMPLMGYFTLSDFGSAIAASVGGALAAALGFDILIIISVIISLLGVGFI